MFVVLFSSLRVAYWRIFEVLSLYKERDDHGWITDNQYLSAADGGQALSSPFSFLFVFFMLFLCGLHKVFSLCCA